MQEKQKKIHYPETEKGIFKQVLAGIGLIGCIGLLVGCTEVVVPGTMAGGGEYYRYTTSNIAKETLMGDVRDVTAAARSALKKMGIALAFRNTLYRRNRYVGNYGRTGYHH